MKTFFLNESENLDFLSKGVKLATTLGRVFREYERCYLAVLYKPCTCSVQLSKLYQPDTLNND